MTPTPEPQHEWLKRFVGEWKFEAECMAEPGKPPVKATGTESVRMLGDLWFIAEGQGDMPSGGPMRSVMTVGYDPGKKRFVGSWVCSVMASMFVYEGELDTAANRLPLNTTGPNPMEPGKLGTFQDVLEIHGPDRRVLWSQVRNDDGTWTKMMSATYTRVK